MADRLPRFRLSLRKTTTERYRRTPKPSSTTEFPMSDPSVSVVGCAEARSASIEPPGFHFIPSGLRLLHIGSGYDARGNLLGLAAQGLLEESFHW